MEQFNTVDCFQWMGLNVNVEWENVLISYEFVSKFESNVHVLLQADKSERELFDEFTYLKKYVEHKLKQWKDSNTKTSDRWIELFEYFDCNNIPFGKIKSIVEFALCLPGSNAITERPFSVVNKIWSTEKAS